jgi:hypothetical protein
MLAPHISYRERTLELEEERLEIMRRSTYIDFGLVFCIVIIAIGMCVYFIFITMQNKTITIS